MCSIYGAGKMMHAVLAISKGSHARGCLFYSSEMKAKMRANSVSVDWDCNQ